MRTLPFLLRLLMRSFRQNVKQFLAVILITFLSTCLFCGLTANAANVAARQQLLFERTDLADLYVTGGQVDPSSLRNVNGVEKAESRLSLPVFVDSSPVYLLSSDSFPSLSHPLIRQGEWGVVLTESFLESKGLEVGGTIELGFRPALLGLSDSSLTRLLEPYLLPGATSPFDEEEFTLSFPVTGTMYHPEAVQNSAFSPSSLAIDEGFLSTALSDLFAQRYDVDALDRLLSVFQSDLEEVTRSFLRGMHNQVLIESEDPEGTKERLERLLSEAEGVLVSLAEEMSFAAGLQQEVDQSYQLTLIFPVFFFLVSLLVILTTLSQLILRERKDIGALKALGVPRRLISLHYALYGFLLTFLGTVLGFVAGPLFLPKVLKIKYDLLWDLPEAPLSFFHVLSFSLCLSLLLLSVLCAFLVSFRVIREKPVETLRPKPERGRRRKPRRLSLAKESLLPLRLAMRNLSKDKGKTAMAFLGTMGCTALLVCGFGILDTIRYDVALDYGTNRNVEVLATPLEDSEAAREVLASDPDVLRSEESLTIPLSFRAEETLSADLILVEADSLSFQVPVGIDGGVTLDEKTAADLGVSLGEELSFEYGGRRMSRVVTHLFPSSFLLGVYGLFDDFPEIDLSPTGFYVFLRPGVDSSAFAARLRESGLFLSVVTYEDLMDQVDDILSSIETMTTVVKAFAILLCVVVVYNLVALNLAQRRREVATLKVLGFRFREISGMLCAEILVDAFLGSLVGLLWGYPLTVLVLSVNRTDLLHYVFHVDVGTYFFALLLSLASTLLVSLFLNLRIRRVSMSESLKSVE